MKNLNLQIKTAVDLVSECERLRLSFLEIQQQIRLQSEQHQEELPRLESGVRAQLQAERLRLRREADVQQETALLDYRTRSESVQQYHQERIRDAQNRLQEEIGHLEERRNSETWILQSILDEDVEDSPITKFDREVDTFVAQKSLLDERLTLVKDHQQHAVDFMASCHASDDEVLPQPYVTVTQRAELRDLAVESCEQAITEADTMRHLHIPQWVRGFRIWMFSMLGFVLLWIPLIAVRADLKQFLNPQMSQPDWQWAAVAALMALAVVVLGSLVLLAVVQIRLRSRFQTILQHISNAEHARDLWERRTQKHIDRMEQGAEEWRQAIQQRRVEQTQKIKIEIDNRIEALQQETVQQTTRHHQDLGRQTQQIDHEKKTQLAELAQHLQRETQRTEQRFQDQLDSQRRECELRFRQATASHESAGRQLLDHWKKTTEAVRRLTSEARTAAGSVVPWPDRNLAKWRLPSVMPTCLTVGDILVTTPSAPENPGDVPSVNLCAEMPAILRFPADTSIVVEHDSAGRELALSFLRRQILKLLTIIPAGRFRLTLIDPVGLGQSFSAMMHLADFDELLIHSRIWTDSSQIRDQLQKVTEHMENIFQTYLRSQFDTIEQYNASAGEVAEPYHFVAVAGFPSAFTEESARHLSSILTSGSRCGVHALIACNPSMSAPPSFDRDDLTNHCVRFRVVGSSIQPVAETSPAVLFEALPEPDAEQYVRLVRSVGEQSKDARRVEVSFSRISPKANDIWTHSSAEGIDLPIGRAGAARLQYLRLGRGTSQHVLIAGKTGSGKSTFLHILITNLALHYSPNEIQFYLIDFKKGVEFRTYAANRLPHARVVAIESDREFGLSVLERLDEILQERGELFRERGAQDVPTFRERFPGEPMPRLLLLIDEFQEFFVAEDRVSSRAALLLDRLVRQGRAFGVHVLLGSQTLGGAYSLARSTMGQIAVRIALQCSETDAHLILSEDNMAARLLARPGEAIYNDANGLLQGNHPFQIAWLDEARREQAIVDMLSCPLAATRKDFGMVVFEGNVAPTPELCGPLNASLTHIADATRTPTDAIRIWLGEPVAIAAPTAIELRRASGQNLLIVGQDEKQADTLLAYAILSCCCGPEAAALQAQAKTTAQRRIILLHDGRSTGAEQQFQPLRKLSGAERLELKTSAECDSVVDSLHRELLGREQNPNLSNGPEQILLIRNIGQFRSLRKDDDDFGLGSFGERKAATTATQFADLLKRGPVVGIHIVVWSDTFNNAIRWVSGSLLREFEVRVAFRMNQTDSASLVDSPVASTLGPGRAVVYRDQNGTTEKFRPFAWPSDAWLRSIGSSSMPLPIDDMDIDSLIIE